MRYNINKIKVFICVMLFYLDTSQVIINKIIKVNTLITN